MKVGFYVKHGYNEIDIPLENKNTQPLDMDGLSDLTNKRVTIYNDIPADAFNPRRFEKFVIDKCIIQGGYAAKTDGTISNPVNAKTVLTKDIRHYKPYIEYITLPQEERENCFTARAGDFIVFSEVDDTVSSAQEFSELQQKYKDNGMKVMSVSENIYGLNVDNIQFTNT